MHPAIRPFHPLSFSGTVVIDPGIVVIERYYGKYRIGSNYFPMKTRRSFTALLLALVTVYITSTSIASAQTTEQPTPAAPPVQQAPPPVQQPAPTPAPTPVVPPTLAPPPVTVPTHQTLTGTYPTSYPHHYLDQHIQLTLLSRSFYATRKQLGCTFAEGVSDKTVSTSVKFSVNHDILQSFLNKLAPRASSKASASHPVLDKPIVHETAMLSDNVARPARVIPAEPAITLQVPESVVAIANSLTNAPLVTSIPLSVVTGDAPVKSASLTGIDARLAHFVTHFDTSEVGRTLTVRRAIELIDGTVLQPQQIFSINQTVGERTVARGFGIGKVFINGTMENQVGGGMCQVATTLFNAALLANLKIIERHQHVRTVPYVPAGGDATVYFGEKDFQFQNNTSTPVYIYYKTYGRYAVCDLFGKGEPSATVKVVTVPTKLGDRYYKGVIRRFVTVNGKTTNDFTAFSTYKWTPALDYLR